MAGAGGPAEVHDEGEVVGADGGANPARMNGDFLGVERVIEGNPEGGQERGPGGVDGAAFGGIGQAAGFDEAAVIGRPRGGVEVAEEEDGMRERGRLAARSALAGGRGWVATRARGRPSNRISAKRDGSSAMPECSTRAASRGRRLNRPMPKLSGRGSVNRKG